MGRYDYSTVRVRPTLSDITAIRLSVLATLLTNRHDSAKLKIEAVNLLGFVEIRNVEEFSPIFIP
jgi:hypothetical protein